MKKINEDFVCINCGKDISKADKTCRNHCPYCFVSLHVDGDIPGDRSAECKSKMYPISYLLSNGVIKILFKCSKCYKEHWNKVSLEDDLAELNHFIEDYKTEFF